MSPKDQSPKTQSSRDERLAKALRDNLNRRKSLARAKRARADADPADPDAGQLAPGKPDRD
jgi:hypothetical protein